MVTIHRILGEYPYLGLLHHITCTRPSNLCHIYVYICIKKKDIYTSVTDNRSIWQ